jgi:hypothetical protein
MPEWGSFSIVVASGTYQFDESPRQDAEDDDFRHLIPIEPETIKSISHRASPDAQIIATSLKGYQKAVNTIRKADVISAIERLVRNPEGRLPQDISTLFNAISERDAEQFFDGVTSRLHNTQPNVFEDIICEMVQRAGYVIKKTRDYDAKGGDADIIAIPIATPLAEAFETVTPVLIQVKNKIGVDLDDVRAVDQLLTRRESYPDATLVVISSADRFTEACEQKAEMEKVRLISRRVLARLLLKYMM